MATSPPPFTGITGIYSTDDKHQEVTRVLYDGTAKPGQLVVDTVDYKLYIGNALGNLNAVYSATTSATTVGGGATTGFSSIVTVAPTFGSSDPNDPSSAQGVRGRVTGTNLTSTASFNIGVTGMYNVTGTNASLFPKVGVLGVIGDTTTTADAAVMAYLDGDGGLTTANSAFGVAMINTTGGSGFKYGVDLSFISTGVAGSTQPFSVADVRLNNGLLIKSVTTAVNDLDATTLPAGTVVMTSNATGVGQMFISTGAALKQLAFLTP
jgi:hypothetical protein